MAGSFCATCRNLSMLLTLLLPWCWIGNALSALVLWTTEHMALQQSGTIKHCWYSLNTRCSLIRGIVTLTSPVPKNVRFPLLLVDLGMSFRTALFQSQHCYFQRRCPPPPFSENVSKNYTFHLYSHLLLPYTLYITGTLLLTSASVCFFVCCCYESLEFGKTGVETSCTPSIILHTTKRACASELLLIHSS